MDEKQPLKITVNGKEYRSLDEVPPEFRAHIEQALQQASSAALAEAAHGPGKIIKALKIEKRFNISLGGKQADAPGSPSPALIPGSGDTPTVQVESFAWLLWALLGIGAALAAVYFIKRA